MCRDVSLTPAAASEDEKDNFLSHLIHSQLVLLLLVQLAVELLQLLFLPHLQLRAPLPVSTHAVPPISPHGGGCARRA